MTFRRQNRHVVASTVVTRSCGASADNSLLRHSQLLAACETLLRGTVADHR
jgi:hypothetical protein